MITIEKLKNIVDNTMPWAIETRRALHKIPETGFQEVKTRKLILEKLAEIGCEFKEENGWITAFVKGGEDGPVTGIRADFDALPVTEPEGCPFRSEHEGWMHACGHDMHTAILLSVGKIAMQLKNELKGGVKLLFQPAEESIGGAKPMVEGGVMENPTVDRVYGLHVMPRLVTGNVETRPNTLNASTDTINITVRGTSSHGAYPENGADAIVCAAQIITALQSIVSRNVSPLESAVITIGKIEGGRASNIICDEVHMRGTLRTANKTLREMMMKRITEISDMIARGMGCTAEAEVSEGYSALVNTPEHADRILDIASEIFGKENALVKDAPSMGGEDFSYFLDKAPGAFFHVGCSPDKDHIGAPLHSELFNPDENAMRVGILMELALAMKE